MVLRELFVRLGLDVDAAAFAKGQLAAELVKASLSKLADVAGAMIHKFVDAVQSTAEFGDDILHVSQASGVGTDSLQRLGKAAAQEGIGIDALGHSLVLLARNLYAAKQGGEEQAGAFRKLNVQVSDSTGKIRGADEVMKDIAERFANLPDGVEKTALSMRLFGRQGAELIDFLNNGRAGLEEFNAAAVATPEQLNAGKEMIIVQRSLAKQTQALWRGAVAPLLPAITALLKRLLAWKKENAEIIRQRIAAVIGTVVKAIGLMASALGVLFNILKAVTEHWKLFAAILIGVAVVAIHANSAAIAALIVKYAALGVAALAAAWKSAAAWALAALPIVAIVAAVALLALAAEDLYQYLTGGQSVIGDTIAMWKRLITEVSIDVLKANPWLHDGLIKIGNMITAVEDAFAAMGASIRGVFDSIGKSWDELTDSIAGVANKLGFGAGRGLLPSGGAPAAPAPERPSLVGSVVSSLRARVPRLQSDVLQSQLTGGEIPAYHAPSAAARKFAAEININGIHITGVNDPQAAAIAVRAEIEKMYDAKMEEARANQ